MYAPPSRPRPGLACPLGGLAEPRIEPEIVFGSPRPPDMNKKPGKRCCTAPMSALISSWPCAFRQRIHISRVLRVQPSREQSPATSGICFVPERDIAIGDRCGVGHLTLLMRSLVVAAMGARSCSSEAPRALNDPRGQFRRAVCQLTCEHAFYRAPARERLLIGAIVRLSHASRLRAAKQRSPKGPS